MLFQRLSFNSALLDSVSPIPHFVLFVVHISAKKSQSMWTIFQLVALALLIFSPMLSSSAFHKWKAKRTFCSEKGCDDVKENRFFFFCWNGRRVNILFFSIQKIVKEKYHKNGDWSDFLTVFFIFDFCLISWNALHFHRTLEEHKCLCWDYSGCPANKEGIEFSICDSSRRLLKSKANTGDEKLNSFYDWDFYRDLFDFTWVLGYISSLLSSRGIFSSNVLTS